MADLSQLVSEARSRVQEISCGDARREIGAGALVVDVREPDEVAEGYVEGALLAPRGTLETTIDTLIPDSTARVLLYCAGGVRSLLAAATLLDLGYTNVASVVGGFTEWKAGGGPFVRPEHRLDGNARYARHLALSEVGPKGQERLGRSRVLIVGTGGLGSPAAMYLAAAGVGTIGLADMDTVDLTNLQRQIVHDSMKLGWAKVDSARQTLHALNPEVTVVPHAVRVDQTNAVDLMQDYDVVIDGADNFDVRYALSDASATTGTPVVYGSVFRFEGQVTVFDPQQGFTYRGFMPEPPSPEVAPNCATAGVLGVLPGIVGTIQATEALKLLLGIGNPLVGRLLVVDAKAMEFTELALMPSSSPLHGR